MATVADLLHQLAKRQAPDASSVLVGPLTLPPYVPAPVPLTVPGPLLKKWSRAVGRCGEAYHAMALAAMNSGETVALMGHGGVPHDDLLLLTLASLQAAPDTAGLWLAPDELVLGESVALLQELNPKLTWRVLGGDEQRHQRGAVAQLTLLTYHDLHRRLLQFHDRAWAPLWPALRFVALPALQQAHGATGDHLRWLVRRVTRLASHVQLRLALLPVVGADSLLPRLVERPVRVVAASPGPTTSTLVALWRCAGDRAEMIDQLATALLQHRLSLTVLGRDAAETALLRAAMEPAIPVGRGPDEARVALVLGVPEGEMERQHLLRAGYRLVLMLAGEALYEQMLVAEPDLLLQGLLHWPLPRSHGLIASQHLLCAATEQPVSVAEAQAWQVGDQLEQLMQHGHLRSLLPGDPWQPSGTPSDPYARIDPATVRGSAFAVVDRDGQRLGQIAPALADRWALPGARWDTGREVLERNATTVVVGPAPDGMLSWPLEEAAVSVRGELARRMLNSGQRRVVLRRVQAQVTAHVRALLAVPVRGQPRELPVAVPPGRRWSATALGLSVTLSPEHPAPGWALVHTFPWMVRASPAALLPWYDAANDELLLIEAEPGGIGLVEVLYAEAERWLERAWRLVQACANQGLYLSVAAEEQRWLRTVFEAVQPRPVPTDTVVAPAEANMATIASATEETASPGAPSREQRLPPWVDTARTPDSPDSLPRPTWTAPVDSVNPLRAAPLRDHGRSSAPASAHKSRAQRPRIYDIRPRLNIPERETPALPRVLPPVGASPATRPPVHLTLVPSLADREAAATAGEAQLVAAESPGGEKDARSLEAAVESPATTMGDLSDLDPVLLQQRELSEAARGELAQPMGEEAVSEGIGLPSLAEEMVVPSQESLSPEMGSPAVDEIWGDDVSWLPDAPRPVQPPSLEGMPSAPRAPTTPRYQAPPARGTKGRRRSQASIGPMEQTPGDRPQRDTHTAVPHRTPSPTRSDQQPPKPPPSVSRPLAGAEPRSQADASPAEAEVAPDVNSMIARMRALREARARTTVTPNLPRRPLPTADAVTESRWTVGERVHCVPFGEGVIRRSAIVDGRETLAIELPDGETIEVDPAVNLVRSADETPSDKEDSDAAI